MIAVKFSTSVCPQCSQQAKLLKKQPLSITLKEVILDKDENGDSLMDALDLMSVPTIIIFNDFNSNLKLIGVTGTDGKTTTATIIKRLLDKKDKTAYIGTNGIEYLNKKESISNTTPTVEKLYKYFSDIDKNNISTVCMEVSSEALLHKRVDSLRFKYVVYTNITEDHLNIHKTIENYIESKLKLSTLLDSNGIIIINNDDNKQKDLKNSNKKIYTYGKNKDSDFLIKDIKYLDNITRFIIEHNNKQYKIRKLI